MRVVVAEDDAITRTMIQRTLERWGHEVLPAVDGEAAWELLNSQRAPMLITDWRMPKVDGLELCRRVRSPATAGSLYVYIIMLAAAGAKQDIVKGLEAGADDYLVKPFDPPELRVRIRCGERIINLEEALAARIKELEQSITRITKLESLLPICSYCKKIRADATCEKGKGEWHALEEYISARTSTQFSHSLCPDCLKQHYGEYLEKARKD